MNKSFYKSNPNHAKFFIKAANDVIKWNAISLNAKDDTFDAVKNFFTQEKFELQIKLVFEELKEYRDAVKVNDHIEMLDALGDIFVVSSYLSYMFFGADQVEQIMNGDVGGVFPEDPYESYMRARESFSTAEQLAYLGMSIFKAARDSLIKTTYDGKAVLTEVLASNMSKFPTIEQLSESHNLPVEDKEQILKAELQWLKDVRVEYEGFTYTFNDLYNVYVFFDGNGKIMKPSVFKKPKIADVIAK